MRILPKRGSKYQCVAMATILSLLGSLFAVVLFLVESKYANRRGHYVCQTFNGKLGNHIYQYASVYGIAYLNNLTIILGQNDDLVRYFEVPSAEIRVNRDICDTFVEIKTQHCCVFDSRIMRLNTNESYKIGEYLQSWKYFSHVFDGVRRELTFKAHIRKSASYIVEQYRDTYTLKRSVTATVVGVHIRRGDIEHDPFMYNDGVILPPDSYIHHAIEFFLKKYENVVFIVCSDGMDYAKEVMQYGNTVSHFIHTSPVDDMAILSSCDHVLTTVGTFGWWAGYLSRGTVLYYKYPMREGSHARTEYNYEDFFPQNWIGLI